VYDDTVSTLAEALNKLRNALRAFARYWRESRPMAGRPVMNHEAAEQGAIHPHTNLPMGDKNIDVGGNPF
jgi:hypothetical protein